MRQNRFFSMRRSFTTMSKRILALLLCVMMLVPCLASCGGAKYEGDVGAYITMYLTDDIYDFDPANAYYNADTLSVVSMMYDTLFTLNENGKVKKSLAKDYKFFVDKRTGENCMEITLNVSYWTNGTRISAADVAYAWRRLLSPNNNFESASLLYDIKNARAVKEGDVSIDNVGVEAVSISTLRITFEGPVDEDRFLLNLTSVATAPLLESYVSRNDDWAKKSSTIVTSGPYKLGKIFYKKSDDKPSVTDDYALDKNGNYLLESSPVKELNYFYLERNALYRKENSRDAIDKHVKNYRILVDCSKTAEEVLDDYKNGKIFYMGSIPLSIRNDAFVQENVEVSNALSTFVLYMNQYASIDNGADGEKLFADEKVRQALSLVIDRDAIAKEIVFAEAAVGLVSPGVFEGVKYTKKDYRDNASAILSTTPNKDEANRLLAEAGVTPSKYSFTIKVAAYDDVHVAIANKVAQAWADLDFKVTVDEIWAIQNNDISKELVSTTSTKKEETPSDVCDDLIVESLKRRNYEVIAFDYTALSADAYSMLSGFATAFSGMSMDFADKGLSHDFAQLTTNYTGYVSVEYSNLMEAIYYIPYYSNLEKAAENSYLRKAYTSKPYVETAKALAQNSAKTVHDANETLDKLEAILTVLLEENEEKKQSMAVGDLKQYQNDLVKVIRLLETADLNLERSFEVSAQNDTTKSAVSAAMTKISQSAKTVAGKTVPTSYDPQVVFINELLAVIAEMKAAGDEIIAAAGAAETAADSADNRTLYEIITKIYSDNGITPSAKTSDWTKQKSILLHKAEEMLMSDLPVIPVVFNQNAILVDNDLSNVKATYYIPAHFQSTKLKHYEDYTYTLNKISKKTGEVVSTEICSIFDEFPVSKWDQKGQIVEEDSLIG